jgi:CheY-like chemotaxis protein
MSDPEPRNFESRLANLRRDLRTPVGHIIGYSELLLEELESAPWPEFGRDLQHIRGAGERIVEQIDEFLGPSKTCAEEIDYNDAQFQMRSQLNHIEGYCEMLREEAEEEERLELIPDLDRIASGAKTIAALLEKRIRITELSLDDDVADAESPDAIEEDASETESTTTEATLELGHAEGGDLLVVDDDSGNRELLRRRLERHGYRITVAESGQGALDLLAHHDFDLILLDVQMQGVSGEDVLKHLKADRSKRSIPVLMLSAMDSSDMVVRCIMNGAEDFIAKPFNPVLLRARISASLEKVRLRRQAAPRIEIFISSPGDVIPERQVVRQLVSQLNDELAGDAVLAPVFWEDEPLLAGDTFQAQIHPPRLTDIYVGIFWSRLGSPLPKEITREDGSRYLSGSEFEFEDALAGFRDSGKPEMLIYMKGAVPEVPLTTRDEVLGRIEQRERLENFVERWFKSSDGESFTSAFHGFDTAEQLRTMLDKHLRKLVLKRVEALREERHASS